MKKIILLIIAIVLLIGLFFILKPKTTDNQINQNTPNNQQNQISNQKTFNLEITDGKLTGSANLLVTEGDEVTIKILSNTADEFHLHGYELKIDLEANKQNELQFTADKTGRFEFELENNHVELGVLEVQPR